MDPYSMAYFVSRGVNGSGSEAKTNATVGYEWPSSWMYMK
tara:strand:+ start:274 stop:393 length:120 start_codon:yes stop_codon:yes gene_type:complete